MLKILMLKELNNAENSHHSNDLFESALQSVELEEMILDKPTYAKLVEIELRYLC